TSSCSTNAASPAAWCTSAIAPGREETPGGSGDAAHGRRAEPRRHHLLEPAGEALVRGQVRLHERALGDDVPAECTHATFGVGVGEGEDGAGAAERAAERQHCRRARVNRPLVLVELVQE